MRIPVAAGPHEKSCLMESTTKNRQGDAVLRTLIARAFGDDEVPTADGFAEEITEG
ncbi:hypothetical protein [Brachybacterium nesterenkovii]|uniref:hypothetical protein n=1 Tax=Brachybacterium nesterenkovii TaxID=47847 RepID=UPI00321B5739